MNERPYAHKPGSVLPEKQSQIPRQQHHLGDEQRQGGGQQQASIRTPQVGERDDVVDAGREQHQQHAEPHHRIGRQELHEHQHEQRDDNEVGDEQRAEEADLPERPLQFRHRHLQERDEQHQRQGRVHCGLERRRAGHEQGGGRGGCDSAEVDAGLPIFQRLPDLLASSRASPAAIQTRIVACLIL